MPDYQSIRQDYIQKFVNSSDLREIISGLQQLRVLQDAGQLSEAERLEINVYAFKTVLGFSLSQNQKRDIESTVLQELLPNCLLDLPEDRQSVYRHREILTELIDRLPQALREEIRAQLIDNLLPSLETSNRRAACGVIAGLGYKETRTLNALWKLVSQNDNEEGDLGLSTLTWLGLTQGEQEPVIRELLARAKKRYNNHLLWALSRLDSIESISFMLSHWLAGQKRSEMVADPSLVFTVIREVLDNRESEPEYEDQLWTKLVEVVEREPGELYWEFDVGHIPSRCNSPSVIPTILRWMEHTEWFPKPAWARYLAGDRIGECIQPRQLEGWANVHSDIFDLLRQDACQDTGVDLLAVTSEMREKEMAWMTLLRAGHADTLTWFDPAVTKETSRFSQKEIMDLLACFIIEPLPKAVIKWMREKYDKAANGTDGREVARRMGAVRIARSTATRNALEILLDFGFTYKGKVILQSTDAIAEVSLYLVRQGDTTIVPLLIKMAKNSTRDHQRLAAVDALEVIASRFPKQLMHYIDELVPLVRTKDRDPIERGLLITLLGHLVDWDIPDALVQDMKEWSIEMDRWVGGSSLYALASHGHLEQWLDLMQETLGLKRINSKWYMTVEQLPFEWVPYTIGLLYHKNPDSYTPAMVALLGLKDWQWSGQIVQWLQLTHKGPNCSAVPEAVEKALIQRIYKRQSATYGETDVFDLVAEITPVAFIREPWKKVVDYWMPDSRVALANALGRTKVDENMLRNCLETLEILSADSMYAVRRCAYRALAKQSPKYLYALCKLWASSEDVGFTKRGGEACGWVENVITEQGLDGFTELFQSLVNHAERSVRETARHSRDERRRRNWAREYLEKVLNVREGTNNEILHAWCYGDALSRTGDDETKLVLRNHISSVDLPPNVRHWLSSILDRLEKNWKKVTQKWPDPWQDIKGAIEQGQGKLIIIPGKATDVGYTLWKEPAIGPGKIGDWGGVILSTFDVAIQLYNIEGGIIETEDGRRGHFTVNAIMGETVVIRGTGHFPGHELAQDNGEEPG